MMPQKAATTPMSRRSKNLEAAELVFTGHPVQVMASPGIWAGMFASFQAVRYRIVRILKGTGLAPGAEVTVLHPLVAQSPTVETEKAMLKGDFFKADRELLVFARRQGDKLICISEVDGVVEVTKEELEGLGYKQGS